MTITENLTNIKTGQTLKHDCKNLNAADLHHFHLDTEIAKWLFSSGETLKRSLHTSYCSLKYFNTEITFHFHSFNPMLCFRSLWLTYRVIVKIGIIFSFIYYWDNTTYLSKNIIYGLLVFLKANNLKYHFYPTYFHTLINLSCLLKVVKVFVQWQKKEKGLTMGNVC